MQKIIALDIGSYSVKAVEILNKFKSYEITNFYEKVIPQIEEIDPSTILPACLGQIFSENALQADRIITAMPGQYISSRIMTFNFSDPNKIESSVLAEVEDVVPFHLEEMIIDHQILGTIGGKTFTLVVMTKSNFLGTFLENLKIIGIDPKLVDVDSLSFYNLSPYLPMEKGKCYGIVDLGHEKTSVCLVQDGVLRMFRSINLGGRYVTDFLARDLEVSFNEAQRIKHRVNVIVRDDSGEGLSKEDRNVAERIALASKPIARELGRSLYAFKTWEKAPIDKIFISGGTSLIKNMDSFLTQEIGIETVSNGLVNSKLQISPELASHVPIMSQGISIGIRAVTSVKRHSQINLRKGPFAYIQDYASVLNTAGAVAKVIAIALLLMGLGYGIKFYLYNREIVSIQEVYKKEIASFPEFKRLAKSAGTSFSKIHRDAVAMLNGRIESKKEAFQGFIKSNSDSGAMVVLQEMSQALPKEVAVEVVEYRYSARPDGSGSLRLRIEADSFDTLAKLKNAMGEVKVFDAIVEKSSDTKPGTDIKIAVIETNYIPR
ncbi:MAG: pilus assembly protein PilM [Deltaproteobacteria bacterium]|nr:pilus assembly protein PilM [Deltaproteobacteria bacterium]